MAKLVFGMNQSLDGYVDPVGFTPSPTLFRLHPVVVAHGKPYFVGPQRPLRLTAYDRIGEDVMRLTYVPA